MTSTHRASALLALALIACTKPEEPAARSVPTALEAPVTTDRSRYDLRPGPFGPETTIITTFKAPADRAVYVMNCNGALPLGLQRLVAGRWVQAWSAETNSCLSAPIVIPAGGRHTGTMTVTSRAEAPDASQRTSTRVEAGTYRAVWYLVLTSFDRNARPFGEELPLEQRVSAPFRIDRTGGGLP